MIHFDRSLLLCQLCYNCLFLFSVYQGAYLLGVSTASLESPKLPWKKSFKETYTCLQFKYILPDTTSEGRNSTLEAFVGNEEQKTLLWKVQGYHGNKSSRANLSWESKKDVMVIAYFSFRSFKLANWYFHKFQFPWKKKFTYTKNMEYFTLSWTSVSRNPNRPNMNCLMMYVFVRRK